MPTHRRPSHHRTQGAIAAVLIAAGAMIAVPRRPSTPMVAPAPEPDLPFGPYLQKGLSVDPATGLATGHFAGADITVNGSAGWIVDPAKGQVRADIPEERGR